jgi:hypothetical protein
MRHIAGYDRSQTMLLPESLDEYVGPENPVRFIDAFAEGLDLAAAGFVRIAHKSRNPRASGGKLATASNHAAG